VYYFNRIAILKTIEFLRLLALTLLILIGFIDKDKVLKMKIGHCWFVMTIILLSAGCAKICFAQGGKRATRRARVVKAQVAQAKHNIDRAQQEIDYALALSLQEQEEQEFAKQRVLQESSREIKEAAAQLKQAVAITGRHKRAEPKNKSATSMELGVKPVRVNVVKQQGTECGYWAALDAVIVFNALKIGLPEVLQDAAVLLRDEQRMRKYLQEMPNVLAKLTHRYDMSLVALDEGAIADIMQYYAHMNFDDYSMFSMPLPYTVSDLPRFQQGIVDIIKRLKKTPDATHVFFLRSGSASTQTIGHWIAIVVHNTGKELVCYIIDSLKSSGYNDTWQRLLHLIEEIK